MLSTTNHLPAPSVQFGYRAEQFAEKRVGRWLKTLDFQKLGATTVEQVKLIYASIIVSRFASALQRMARDPLHRNNELRETATRDPLGFTVWLFGIPVLQRMYLKMIPQKYRNALLWCHPPQAGQTLSKSQAWLDKLKRCNPMKSLSILSNHELVERMHQELEVLERAGHGAESAAYKTMQDFYKRLIRYNLGGTALGWAATIALLGVGVIVFNITMTNKKNAQRQINR